MIRVHGCGRSKREPHVGSFLRCMSVYGKAYSCMTYVKCTAKYKVREDQDADDGSRLALAQRVSRRCVKYLPRVILAAHTPQVTTCVSTMVDASAAATHVTRARPTKEEKSARLPVRSGARSPATDPRACRLRSRPLTRYTPLGAQRVSIRTPRRARRRSPRAARLRAPPSGVSARPGPCPPSVVSHGAWRGWAA